VALSGWSMICLCTYCSLASIAGIQEKLGILNNGEVFAVFSYDANQSDEVGFTVNDKLTILRKGDESEREWWWARDMNEREGYVPRNLLGVSNINRVSNVVILPTTLIVTTLMITIK
jgi:SH3 domain